MTLWQDIRFGLRTLRKSPGYTTAAVLTLALGIGATTAVFSVSDSVMWKPMPALHLDRLAVVTERVNDDPTTWKAVSPADTIDISRQQTCFEQVTAWEGGSANIVGNDGEPERVNQFRVKPNFFSALGVSPALGRSFAMGEDQEGSDRVVVLSDSLWKRRFAADRNIVGKKIRLDDADFLVIGVAPAGFEFPLTSELWTPLSFSREERHSRDRSYIAVIGVLKPGLGMTEAQAELDTIGSRLARQYPDSNRDRRFRIVPMHRFLLGPVFRDYLVMVFGAVLFVLLIACVNVANLQFARAIGRTREVALRTSLGASRRRLVVQFLSESMLLALGGGLAGLALASWGIAAIQASMPAGEARYIPGWGQMSLDGRVLAFTMFAALASGILAGLAPALRCSHPNLTRTLSEGGRGSSSSPAKLRVRGILVTTEVALSVVLLAGASLMARGLSSVAGNARIFEPSTLLTLRLAITERKYPAAADVRAYYHDVLERIAAIPGVESAVAVTRLPYRGHDSAIPVTIEGRQPAPGQKPEAMYQPASPNLFHTLHISLREGRLLSPSDSADSPPVAVVSAHAARTWFPGEGSPLGKRIRVDRTDGPGVWKTIVGVVDDVPYDAFDRVPRAVLYVPYTQETGRFMDIGVRTYGDPRRFAHSVGAALLAVDKQQPVTSVLTLEEVVKHRTLGLIYVAVEMAVFGVIALILSSIGVYGVMSYLVAQETHDIGIRMALGAQRSTVMGMLFRRGMATAGVGLALGLAAALGMARLLASLLFGIGAGDPVTFIAIPLALAAAAALAIYIPARRAVRIDPMDALRCE
ncbi:MAG: ABC transporter permease [Bryobacteraceae bacterium]